MENIQMTSTNGNKVNNLTHQITCPHCDGLFNINEAVAHAVNKGKKEADSIAEKQIRNRLEKKFRLIKQEDDKKLIEKIKNENSLELKELQEENATTKDQLAKYSKDRINQNKLQLKVNTLERENKELESSLRVDIENDLRPVFKEEADKRVHEKELELAEEKLKNTQLKKKIEESKEIANQGSMQIQGEAMQMVTYEWLRNEFSDDEITEVKKGVSGADFLQKIINRGKAIGTICVESKKTKRFDDSWIEKLKKDMKNSSADMGIIVTKVLPKDLPEGGGKNGICIYNFHQFKIAIHLLRTQVIKVKEESKAMENSNDKSSRSYKYLIGSKYRSEIETQVSTIWQLQQDHNKDKNTTLIKWAKTEEQHENMIKSLCNVHGTLRGIAGNAVPEVEILQLSNSKLISKKKSKK